MVLILLLAVVAVVASPVSAQGFPRPDVVAKNLAENILGEGTVRWVRVTEGGRQIDIGWDAVLYRTTNTLEHNRQQLHGEATLATDAIMRVMHPASIRFTMMLTGRIIARGERTPAGFTITYAKELGG